MASSGIAALLFNGSTPESLLKVPLVVNDASICGVKKNSKLSKYIRDEVKVIIWDEISMANKYKIECVDRLLKDIMDSRELFGGKLVIFSGDFKQTLPIVPKGVKSQIINSSLLKSYIYKSLDIYKLNINMRLRNIDN